MKWWTKSWNPVTGCDPVSEACDRCYARRMARRLAGRHGYPDGDDYFKLTQHPDRLQVPFSWNKPQRIFVGNMGDIFHPMVPDAYLDEIFFPAYTLNQHIWMFLTKRVERMAAYLKGKSPLGPHVWLGVTAENQIRADERLPILFSIQAGLWFVSVEPMLGWVDLARHFPHVSGLRNDRFWVICGGETGPGSRIMDPGWAYDLMDQCRTAGVPFFFKQNYGGYPTPALLGVREIPREAGSYS